jgi:hypothetical protein
MKKLADRVIGIGPFGVGLDAMLTFIPVVSPLYSAGAGLWLMSQAVRARATPGTLARMAAYLITDTATDAVPIAGSLVDIVFPGHLMAAKALQKDIESTHWIEGRSADARASGAWENHRAHVGATKGLRRVVYLHD